MKYLFQTPIALQTAAATRLRRMVVGWETGEVRIFLDIENVNGILVGSREYVFTLAQLDAAIALPGATLEEKILRGIPTVVTEVPPGGTIVP